MAISVPCDADPPQVSQTRTTQPQNDSDSNTLPLSNQEPVTTTPIAKPRTIRSMSGADRKPVPPVRKLLPVPSLVNVRNNQPIRQPINVIIDVNNSLWRNIRIQDMDENLLNGDYSITIAEQQQQSSNANNNASPCQRTRQCSEDRSECENDPINVLVEDITHCKATLHDVDASSSYESDEAIFNLDQSIMRMGPEWVVPQEYSSSPIVQELAESCEERPKPPLISQYASSLAVATPVAKISRQEKKVSILEQIVRSHPIWYLQHIGRPTATHLLRQMEPGNFIVRASSKKGCMAISVRLPDEHDMKTEHYIVEYGETGSAIRLESSPYSFRSLPLLIEHYCSHSEELQVRLRLPTAVMLCRTTKELQSVALLGQDFWTSEAALLRSTPLTSEMSTQSTSFMNLDEGIPVFAPSYQTPPDYRSNLDMLNKTSPKKRSSSGRSMDDSRLSTTYIDADFRSAINIRSDVRTNSPPTKHDRTEVSPVRSGHISRSERRTQSVRTKSVNPPPVSGALSTGRKSFLKSLFFGSGSNSSQNRRAPINQLAQCQYFVPLEKETVRNSKSAFEISSTSRNGNLMKKHAEASMMSTFKPSYDEVVMSARVCPLPMRRERSDLCASSVMRLAKHTEHSPGPICVKSIGLKLEPQKHQVSPKRKPLRPPEFANDPIMINNCIDELRRRLPSRNEKRNSAEVPSMSQFSGPQVSFRPRQNSDSSQPVGVDSSSYVNRASRRDHRMSVPNLSPESSNVVVQSAKALKEKLGRNGDGELSTINEGLITPVIRRKQFNQPSTLTSNVNGSSFLESPSASRRKENSPASNGHKVSGGTLVSRGREALEALFSQQQSVPPTGNTSVGLGRRFNSDRVRNGRESELIWRRTNQNSLGISDKPVGELVKPSTNKGHCFLPNKSGSNWSAINSELKSKQKVAKVRPTLQSRVLPSTMTIDGVGKNSEYAHLSEFTTVDAPKLEVRRDDDDDVSIAGTVFNEPWDSNVWENLLDLANHGDESLSTEARQLSATIHEEDSDSDRTAGGSTRMHESEDELDDELWSSMTASARRKLPSDRVTCKAWENDEVSNYGTIDSSLGESLSSTLRRCDRRAQTPPNSMNSLSRANSGFSQQIGSLDDLPLSLATFSPNLNSGRKTTQHESSLALQSYVERLAEDQSTVFGATLKRFIECTVQSEEADPNVVVRNVRQFINGIKNYLVKHGEGDLHALIDQESAHLNANQILNIDAILESVLHKLLLRRVKPHLYHVMVKENSRAGGLQALSANIAYVRTLSLADLGFSNADQLIAPSASVMEQIKNCLRKMQHHYSPLKKLENLLRAISIVLSIQSKCVEKQEIQKTIPGDDLVRWLVYIIARSSTVGCEVEAWYMWELLPQQMITKGDAAYYLTALFSAVHVLKSIDAIKKLAEKDADMVSSMDLSRQLCSSTPSTSDAFVRVAIPDEVAGCIRYATFPGVPQMTTGKLCRVIAHQQGITNPEDHGLYLIVNGFESCLLPHECPDAIRDSLRGTGKPHLFAYKRHDAKIGWPRQVMSTPS